MGEVDSADQMLQPYDITQKSEVCTKPGSSYNSQLAMYTLSYTKKTATGKAVIIPVDSTQLTKAEEGWSCV